MLSRIQSVLNRKKVISVLIFSYAIMLALPFIAGILSFWIGNTITKDYIIDIAASRADTCADKFDDIIIDHSQIHDRFYFDEEIKDLCNSINSTEDVFAMRELSSKLKYMIYGNDSISEIAVFPFGSDYVILSNGFYDKDQYYESYIKSENITREEYEQIINDDSASFFRSFPDSLTFAYSTNIPVANGKSPARMLIQSDSNKVFKSMLADSESFFVFNNDILINRSETSDLTTNSDIIRSMSEKGVSKYTSNNLFANMKESSVSNLTYYYFTDLHSISTSKTLYIIISLIIFIIAFFIGVLMFKLFIEIQYKPINQVINHIKSQLNTESNVYSFDFINSNIGNLERDILNRQEKYMDQNNLLLSMRLSQWLMYNILPACPEEIIELQKEQFYVVISITFQSLEDLFFEYNPQDIGQNTAIAKFIIENTISEMFDDFSIKSKMIEFEDCVVAIVFFSRDQSYKDILENIFDYVSEFVQKEFNLEPCYYCSSACNSYEMLHTAYNETLVLLNGREPMKSNCCFYDDITFNNDTKTAVLEDSYKRLFKSISAGDAEKAQGIINEICMVIDDNASVSYTRYVLSCLIFSINNALLVALPATAVDIQQFIQRNAPIDMVMNANNNNNNKDLQTAVINYSNNACKYIKKIEQRPNSVSHKAKAYINEYYYNSQLTSSLVASEVGLSRDYFLKLFKHQTGESMLDYLNKVRIEKACEILKSEKCSLNEVAARVGYTNVKTFTRAFIKHMGITPGKYNN